MPVSSRAESEGCLTRLRYPSPTIGALPLAYIYFCVWSEIIYHEIAADSMPYEFSIAPLDE